MANQSPDRRRVLEMLATAAVVAQFPGFSRWVFAAPHTHSPHQPLPPRSAHYQPRFFTAAEFQTIDDLTELIIPADETPGAHAAGVSEFIDFMAAHGDKDLPALRTGLTAFAGLSLPGQEALLKTYAYQTDNPQQQAFFQLLRRYTVMGYYTSRIGLQELSFPGLQFYSQSPECPHKDDPEHRHLPPALLEKRI